MPTETPTAVPAQPQLPDAGGWSAAVLSLPRLRIQNANALSSPMTWGFPAIHAFTGLAVALERRLGPAAGLRILGMGVICHDFEPQVSRAGYTRSLHLTRNPLTKEGATASIVEEGRVHLTLTLVLDVEVSDALRADAPALDALALQVADLLARTRVAGGSVLPPRGMGHPRPRLTVLPDDAEARSKLFRQLARRWLPGFALVSRDDLLRDEQQKLQAEQPQANALDAWLSLSRWTYTAQPRPASDPSEATPAVAATAVWQTQARPGWLVPMPVGYAAVSALYPPGTVASARDTATPFCFVESVYSIGQWISPHRLRRFEDLFWYAHYDPERQLYRCKNGFQAEVPDTASDSIFAPANTDSFTPSLT